MFKRITSVVLFLAVSHVGATGLDISISDETAEVMFLTHTSTLGLTKRAANADTQERIEGADIAFGAFFNSNNDYLAHAEVMVKSRPVSAEGSVQFGLGVRASYGELDVEDSLANLSIGGEINLRPYFARKMTVGGELFYSPLILSFMDSEELLEYAVDVKFELVPSSILYFGYRKVTVDTPTISDLELEDNFHVGVRLTF
ncbi:MAG TPA: hypothetical protein DCZ12_09950 [Gammaproteobacteria bacterium]|jgi:YfaZ precursor.|nr:hypothetical protein [Gammaproteobacteria bacterium]